MPASTLSRQSPPDLTVRNLRFRGGPLDARRGDPVARTWFIALSCCFPRGEAMFVESVKAHREGAPPKLAIEIRDFIRQEVNHSREHLAFNRLAADAGYDIAAIDARVTQMVGETLSHPPIVGLAVTMALEHFTAIFAHQFLRQPETYLDDLPGDSDLWLWHSIEEIEHKGVAFDTWLHATRGWPARKRWLTRSMVMLQVTARFLSNRLEDARDLLAQEGITGWRARLGQWRYLWLRPGLLRKIFPAWLAYFRPGFHPWDHDDSALIAQWAARFTQTAEAAE